MSIATRPGRQVGPIGMCVRPRAIVLGVLVLGAIAVLAVYTLSTGTVSVPLDRVIAALGGSGTSVENLVVLDNRLPPLLIGSLVGFCLGVAGALTQTVTGNPIATPDILGVTTGAAAFATFVVVVPGMSQLIFGMASARSVVLAALIGGVIASGIILLLAWRGGFDGYRLILVGLGVNAISLAVIDWLLTIANDQEAAIAARWLVGSVDGAEAADLTFLAPAAGLGVLACVVLSGRYATIRLGRDVAASLGTNTTVVNGVTLAVAVVLVSAATAAAGPISFVAFVAPHVALRLFRTAGPPPIAGGLIGALFLVAAHVITTLLPVTVPVGIVTAVVGAPALLVLVLKQLRRTSA